MKKLFIVEDHSRAQNDRREGIIHNRNGKAGDLPEENVEILEEGAASHEHDALPKLNAAPSRWLSSDLAARDVVGGLAGQTGAPGCPSRDGTAAAARDRRRVRPSAESALHLPGPMTSRAARSPMR